MGRARSPDSIKAQEMYESGMKLVDISKNLGVPAGTVRRWKSTQNWDGNSKKKQSERSQKKKTSVRKRKNAPGAGPPLGSQNHLKHGGYSEVYWDTLDEDEQAFLEDRQTDEEQMLIDQITLYSIRERRLMKAINQYKDAKGGIYMSSTFRIDTKRSFKDDEEREEYEDRIRDKVDNGDRLPGEQYTLQTQTSATIELIARLERELTSVQSKKTKAIDSLIHLRMEKERIDKESAGNDAVNDWIAGVLGDGDTDGG